MSSHIEQQLVDNLVSSNHKFMMNLYQSTVKDDENMFFSPVSVYIALTLVYLGANGKTAEELEKHLFLPHTKEQSLEGVKHLLKDLNHPELNTATEMFVERSYKLQAAFKDNAKKLTNSESQLVDFKKATDEARNIINSWVSSQTNNKINDLIPAGILDESTRLVLVNAIHFKDTWSQQFDKQNTCKEKFFTSKSSSKEVDMMHKTATFRYKQEDTFQVLELPYANKNFKMVIFLPNEIDGLAALERKLSKLDVPEILHSMTRVEVDVSLPKFKLEKSIDLNDALRKLGISTMFDPNEADLTGIHERTEERLFVSKVLHKAFVEVNEEGTEAAAATGVILMARCIRMNPTFNADHPFIFFILGSNNVNLFFGKISSPVA